MREEIISRAMGGIDPAYVLAAAQPLPRSRSKRWLPKTGWIAACMALLLVCAGVLAPLLQSDTAPVGFAAFPGVWSDTEEGTGSEEILASQYRTRIQDGAYADYLGGAVIDPAEVGEPLGEVRVAAWWQIYRPETTDREPTALAAQAFAIRGVDPSVAICLRYTDADPNLTTTHYYTFCHPAPDFSTLTALWTATGGEVQVARRIRCYRLLTDWPEVASTVLPQQAQNDLAKALLQLTATRVTDLPQDGGALLEDCTHQIVLTVLLPHLGMAQCRVHLTQNGYLLLRFCDTWQVYRPEEAAHAALWAQLSQALQQAPFAPLAVAE